MLTYDFLVKNVVKASEPKKISLRTSSGDLNPRSERLDEMLPEHRHEFDMNENGRIGRDAGLSSPRKMQVSPPPPSQVNLIFYGGRGIIFPNQIFIIERIIRIISRLLIYGFSCTRENS